MRDATRGGVATVLNEIALSAELGVVIEETRVPVRPEVIGAGEILGIDPLYVANEGKLVAFVAADKADAALAALRELPEGADAAIVGEVRPEPPGRVLGRTAFGGHRMIDMLVGDPLPRIC
jgi:hydrogenase expression/formation protein HypE